MTTQADRYPRMTLTIETDPNQFEQSALSVLIDALTSYRMELHKELRVSMGYSAKAARDSKDPTEMIQGVLTGDFAKMCDRIDYLDYFLELLNADMVTAFCHATSAK